MEFDPAFVLNDQKLRHLRRARLESWVILTILALIGIFTITDIISDLGEGASITHLLGEAFVAALSLIGSLILWRRTLRLRSEVIEEREVAQLAEAGRQKAVQEALRWKNEAASAIRGLSDAIDLQMTRWQLTRAEKEVTLLLLKGLSLKEVAEVRGVSEKTARAQSFAVYAKSGLSGRAELSAFFLEDLLVPIPNSPTSFTSEQIGTT